MNTDWLSPTPAFLKEIYFLLRQKVTDMLNIGKLLW